MNEAKVKSRITHNAEHPVGRVKVRLLRREDKEDREVATTYADLQGSFEFAGKFDPGEYRVHLSAFGVERRSETFRIEGSESTELPPIDLGRLLQLTIHEYSEAGRLERKENATAGKRLVVRFESGLMDLIDVIKWDLPEGARWVKLSDTEVEGVFKHATRARVGVRIQGKRKEGGETEAVEATYYTEFSVLEADLKMIGGEIGIERPIEVKGPLRVQLQRTAADCTLDQALWVAIRNRTHAISFGRYHEFMNRVLRWEEGTDDFLENIKNENTKKRMHGHLRELGTHLHGVGAYQILKLMTEIFLLLECGVRIEWPREHREFREREEARRFGDCANEHEEFEFEDIERKLRAYLGEHRQLPYITRVVREAFPELYKESWSGRLISARINEPCLIELIWSYWLEEGMLVQTINAVSQRFQNLHGPGQRDPLANMEIDPLRPLNNLLWGYVQDELNRLSVRRRSLEYMHQYGLTLYGAATAGVRPAESRSKFLEAFHHLLYRASVFFKEDYQTTVIADGFPLLNSLKEVHLILAQGAHNQFGDLAWTGRVEMLLMEFILGRREIRDFLQSRAMVPYKEAWEPQVDAMKGLQGWTDVTVSHFRDLADYGEKILLSVRYGDWINVVDEDSAKNWARYWRSEILAYLHAYRAVTGIDLTNPDTIDPTIPGIHLQKRLVMQRTR